MNKNEFKILIEKSISELFVIDGSIIKKKVKEECINHRLANYFERNLFKMFPELQQIIKVDIEYNKNYSDPKKILIDELGNKKNIRPDIIVHQRETNQYNLLVVEAKKYYPNKQDIFKIKKFLEPPYSYRYGITISYLPEKNYFRLKIFTKDSTKITEEILRLEK